MAAKASSDNTDRVFDVAKPGKSAPSTSSRPIIVSHQTAEDPMVAKPAATNKTIRVTGASSPAHSQDESEKVPEVSSASAATLSSKDRITITPLASAEPDKQEKAPEEKADESPVAEESVESSESASVDAVAAQAGSSKGAKAKADEQEAGRREALEKIIESKKYAVPISETRHARALERFLIILLLIMLIGIVGVNLAIDAGLIETDIEPVVDLIKN